jgi:uncharacterized membrane protein
MSQPNMAFSGAGNAAEGGTARIIYILYLVGLIVGVTSIVGVIMAYVHRSEAAYWVQSHYQLQIRTFWIGVVYGLICMVTSFILIGYLLMLAMLVWWIVRCAKGLRLASMGMPYDNPTSWLW